MPARAVGRPQLLVIRHGETEWSRTGRHTGRTDVPLSDQGRAEARDAARTLDGWNINRSYTSPLGRARETAELVEPACGVLVEPDLVEWDYGKYEGVTTAEIRETVPGWTVWTHGSPGGEDADQVCERLDRVVARLRATAGRSLLFGHGHALRALTARWLDQPVLEGRNFVLDTATVSVLGFERDTPAVRRWNC
jgi:broad specificity phosphatase PhoE